MKHCVFQYLPKCMLFLGAIQKASLSTVTAAKRSTVSLPVPKRSLLSKTYATQRAACARLHEQLAKREYCTYCTVRNALSSDPYDLQLLQRAIVVSSFFIS